MASTTSHRLLPRAAGLLYIIGTVTGVLSVAVIAPVREAPDPMAAAAQHPDAVIGGALLVLAMGLSLAAIPVVLYPVLRRVDEVLAAGYLVLRGAVEAILYAVLAIGWLLLVPLGEAMAAGPGTGSPMAVRLAGVVLDPGVTDTVLPVVFCLGATAFYVLLYRSRVLPRWVAAWGLAAVPLYVTGHLLGAYDVVGPGSAWQTLLIIPLAVQEMVLAGWMIARGFRPAVVGAAAGSAPEFSRP